MLRSVPCVAGAPTTLIYLTRDPRSWSRPRYAFNTASRRGVCSLIAAKNGRKPFDTPKDPADPPSAAELAAARELVRQARAQGVALTGPGRVVEGVDEDGGTRNLDPLDEPGRQMV